MKPSEILNHSLMGVVGLAFVVTLSGCDVVAGTNPARLESDGPASGFRVAVDGTTAIVSSSSRGAVAVHERGPDGWTRTADLLPDDADVGPESRDRYGWSVALDDGVAVIGAYGSNGGRGRAYVFERLGDRWEAMAVLDPGGLTTESQFGRSVAVGAGRVFVSRIDPGGDAVFVYERRSSRWELTGSIEAPDPGNGRYFGWHLATDGVSLVVTGAAAIGDLLTNGVIYVYGVTGPYDAPSARLTTQIGYEELSGLPDRPRSDGAGPVAVDGGVIVVGAPYLSVGEGLSPRGAGLVFERTDGRWSGPIRLHPADQEAGDRLGQFAVATGGGTVSISSDLKGGTGTVYTFGKVSGEWVQTTRLQQHDIAEDQGFGTSLSQDGDVLVVGAPYENGEDGAAYVYRRAGDGWTPDAQ